MWTVYYHAGGLKQIEQQFFAIQNNTASPDRYLRPLAKSKVCYFSGLSQPLL
jgi:hypothetical protein